MSTNGMLAWACAAMAFTVVSPVLAGGNCSPEVAAAFEKQRTGPGYRVVSRQQGPTGEIVNTADFIAPDRMHNTVEVPGQPAPLETIAIGRWAWANQGGGWQELQPQFAQAVTSDVAAALGRPAPISDAFTCVGKVARDGREYVAYATPAQLSDPSKPKGPGNPELVRTVLIDPSTGLPAYNIVDEPLGTPVPLVAIAYSHPKDLKIEAPDAVPAGRSR